MKDLLLKAAAEIRGLRSENRILAAKVEVIDIFAAALSADPRRRGETWVVEDILTELMRAAEMDERAKAAAEAAYGEFDAADPSSGLPHVSV
jgi:hypothetical protein